MMASSKDKAIALKDNYVAGLIEAGATAPAPTMPEIDMGQQAAVYEDVGLEKVTKINNGVPTRVVMDSHNGIMSVNINDRSAAMPLGDANSANYGYDFPKKGQVFGMGGTNQYEDTYAKEYMDPRDVEFRKNQLYRDARYGVAGNLTQRALDNMNRPRGTQVSR